MTGRRAGTLALVALLASCSPVPLGDGERRVIARELATEVIVPSYDEVVVRAAVLRGALVAFGASPTPEALAGVREAWRGARSPWKAAEAFGFGPAVELRLAVAIDQTPIDPAKIEAELAGTAVLDDDHVENLGANAKGFHTIEYLAFRDDQALTDPRRRAYLVALGENLERKAVTLRGAWVEDYADLVATPGSTNAEYPTITSVIDTLVNETVVLAELIAADRLGKPLGTANGGAPDPELEESGPSDNSIADMASALRGLRNIYLGTRATTGTRGISALVAAHSPATDREVREAIDKALATIELIPRPYRQALLDQRAEVTAAYDAVNELHRILATEVIAVLGATLKFNENDGD